MSRTINKDLTGLFEVPQEKIESEFPVQEPPPAHIENFLVEEDTPPLPQKEEPSALSEIKKFSENLSIGKPIITPEFPFSLLITGALKGEEKNKLLELLAQHQMGIREIDLEPQWVSQRVLIPRISEYAGILLVQALRGSNAEIEFGPSDTIFSTPETRSEPYSASIGTESLSSQTDIFHPAEKIFLTSQASTPELTEPKVIDTVTASTILKAKTVEAESSSEYQEILEALQRELKYKAYRKKASGILNFTIQLFPLSNPMHYRIQVSGTAVA